MSNIQYIQVIIEEVNPNVNTIIAKDPWGHLIYMDLAFQPGGIITIPRIGEQWIAKKMGASWVLDRRLEDGSDPISVYELSPGDKRVSAANDLYLYGNRVLINDVPFSVPEKLEAQKEGQTLIWNGQEFIPDYPLIVKQSANTIGQRRVINFYPGTNVTIDCVDDPIDKEVEITIHSEISVSNGGPYQEIDKFTIAPSDLSVVAREATLVPKIEVSDGVNSNPSKRIVFTGTPAPTVTHNEGITTVAYNVPTEVPTGAIMMWSTNTAPNGWLICDGSAVSRTTYEALHALFQAAGYPYGSGDGSTTFNLPNLKGRIPVGRDTAQTEFDTLAEVGGQKTHTLTTNEMPSHKHSVSVSDQGHTHSHSLTASSSGSNHAHSSSNDQMFATGNGSTISFSSGTLQTLKVLSEASNYTANDGSHSHSITGSISSGQASLYVTESLVGGGGSHNNLQPYIVLNYIIKT